MGLHNSEMELQMQVFVALLRTCQPENKLLVKQALDILMPALPRRLPLGDSRMPIWIRYTKKILVEEGHSIPNLIHIFQLIVAIQISSIAAEHSLYLRWSILSVGLDCHIILQQKTGALPLNSLDWWLVGRGKGKMK